MVHPDVARTHARPARADATQVGGAVQATTGLDAGLLIGTQDEIIGVERRAVPLAIIQIQHPPRFGLEVAIARKTTSAYTKVESRPRSASATPWRR